MVSEAGVMIRLPWFLCIIALIFVITFPSLAQGSAGRPEGDVIDFLRPAQGPAGRPEGVVTTSPPLAQDETLTGILKWLKVLDDQVIADYEADLRAKEKERLELENLLNSWRYIRNINPGQCMEDHTYSDSNFCTFQSDTRHCTIQETQVESDKAFAHAIAELEREEMGSGYIEYLLVARNGNRYTAPYDPVSQMELLCLADGNANPKKCRLHKAITLQQKMMEQLVTLRESYPDSIAKYVYQAWNRHPTLRYYCEGKDLLVDYIKLLTDFNSDITSYLMIWQVSGTVLMTEVREVCALSQSDPFCIYNKVITLAEELTHTRELKADLPESSEAAATAATVAMKMSFRYFLRDTGEEFSDIQIEPKADLYLQASKFFFSLLMANNLHDVSLSMVFFRTIETTHLQENSISGSLEKALLYNLQKILEQARVFLYVKTDKIKVLNTNVDFKTLLVNQQMNQLLNLVQGQQTDLQNVANSINSQMEGIKDYFESVETFNKEKSATDIESIKSSLIKYKTSSQNLQRLAGDNVDNLINYAIASAVGQAVEQTVFLGLKIAAACNPLAHLVSGGKLGDVMKASAELVNTLANIAKAAALKGAVRELVEKSAEVMNGFQKNENMLRVIASITDHSDTENYDDFEKDKETFFLEYGNYGSAVKKTELEALSVYWNAVVDAACFIIIKGSTTTASGAIKTIVEGNNWCVTTKVHVKRMVSTYLEILAFQGELIETIATYMKSLTGIHVVRSINADLENIQLSAEGSQDKVILMQQTAALMLLAHKYQTWSTIEDYCDVLEYKNAGKRPDVCKGQDTNIAALVAHTEPSCDNEIRMFVTIPTGTDNEIQSSISLSSLYSEEEVIFQIDDQDWLRRNGWIGANDEISAAYIKEFEVYAPTVTKTFHRVKSVVSSPFNNVLVPGGLKYRISPHRNMVFEYQQGRNIPVCRNGKFQNPYIKCLSQDLSYICPLSNGLTACKELQVRTRLYPSVFSTWKIKLEGFKYEAVPNPKTELPLKVGVLMCTMYKQASSPDLSRRDLPEVPAVASCTQNCCPAGQFMSTVSGECTPCPANSTSALGGYYCKAATN